jgi:hypothetical protein
MILLYSTKVHYCSDPEVSPTLHMNIPSYFRTFEGSCYYLRITYHT